MLTPTFPDRPLAIRRAIARRRAHHHHLTTLVAGRLAIREDPKGASFLRSPLKVA